MSNSNEGKMFPLYILMLNIFIAIIGQGMVMPILPDYLRQFNQGGAAAGYLVAFFAAAQFIFSPIGGQLSDKHGRKKMILCGMALTVISDFIFAISHELILLYIARFIGGIGLGIMIPSNLAYVADITTKETRAKGMGYFSAYSLYVKQKYGFNSQVISIIITLGAVIGIVVQVGLIYKVIKRYGEYKLIRFSLFMSAVALVLMLVKVNLIYLLAISAVFFAFNSFLRPTVNTMLANKAGNEQGFVSGLSNTYTSLGGIIAPIMAGNLFEQNINLPYAIGAVILIGTIGLTFGKNKMNTKEGSK